MLCFIKQCDDKVWNMLHNDECISYCVGSRSESLEKISLTAKACRTAYCR